MKLAYFERWIDPAANDILEKASNIELVQLNYSDPFSENRAKMGEVHGYQISPGTEIKSGWRAEANLLDACPNLLAISSTGAGYDMIDDAECTRRGILVCNQSGSNHHSVAEHALGFMLALSKQIVKYGHIMPRQTLENRFDYPGKELLGKTVGIIGIGQIGSRTAELCGSLLKMKILAYDPFLSEEEIAARGAQKVELNELLQQSDFVSLHCPLTSETRGMLGAEEFALMKPSAYFVTTARGGIHDEADLERALSSGQIAGAGIDVFDVEPPSQHHPLLHLDNVIATPHIAGITEEAMRSMAVAAAEQWKIILAGEIPPRLINPEVWPRYVERYTKIIGNPPKSLSL